MKSSALALVCFSALCLAVRLAAQDADAAHKPAPARHRDDALADVLADYGKIIGKQIVTDNTVNPTATLTIPGLEGISTPQKASLIARSLFLNNYTLVDADKDTVVVLGPGRSPRSIGVPLYTKPEELPADERVFSYRFKLEHQDPVEFAGFLQQYIPPGNDVNFTAYEHAQTVIATGPTSVMRVVLKLVATLDASDRAGQ